MFQRFGEFEGCHISEYHSALKKTQQKCNEYTPPGGESILQVIIYSLIYTVQSLLLEPQVSTQNGSSCALLEFILRFTLAI